MVNERETPANNENHAVPGCQALRSRPRSATVVRAPPVFENIPKSLGLMEELIATA
jgi:hypothetical protein